MKFAACPPSTDIRLQPSPGLALAWLALSLLAAAAGWYNDLVLLMRLILIGFVAAIALPALRVFLRPSLSLRIGDLGLQYRAGPAGPWRTLPSTAYCFASPWYVGWRGRGWRSHGVFRHQLPPDQFRRLLVAMRYGRPDD